MKYFNLILLLICFNTYGQEWVTDSTFDSKINEKQAFGDDQTLPVVVEFWAEFNDANKFEDWNKLEDVVYYRADITKCPEAKKKYKVRMVPTIIIFKEGIKGITLTKTFLGKFFSIKISSLDFLIACSISISSIFSLT